MAFSKNKPELGKWLAVHALKKFYAENSEESETLCLHTISSTNKAKILLKVQREQLNHIIVRSVIEDLDPEKKNFIEYKYKRNFNLVKIAMELNVSKARLCVWQTEILGIIENMLFYRLMPEDFFNPRKILSMLYILDQQISYLETNCTEFIHPKSFCYLTQKQQEYLQVYQILSECLESEDTIKPIKIMQSRISLGQVPASVIAKEGECSIARVSSVLKRYQEFFKTIVK